MKVASFVGDTMYPRTTQPYMCTASSALICCRSYRVQYPATKTLKTRLMKDLQVGLNSVHSGEGFADLAEHQ